MGAGASGEADRDWADLLEVPVMDGEEVHFDSVVWDPGWPVVRAVQVRRGTHDHVADTGHVHSCKDRSNLEHVARAPKAGEAGHALEQAYQEEMVTDLAIDQDVSMVLVQHAEHSGDTCGPMPVHWGRHVPEHGRRQKCAVVEREEAGDPIPGAFAS